MKQEIKTLIENRIKELEGKIEYANKGLLKCERVIAEAQQSKLTRQSTIDSLNAEKKSLLNEMDWGVFPASQDSLQHEPAVKRSKDVEDAIMDEHQHVFGVRVLEPLILSSRVDVDIRDPTKRTEFSIALGNRFGIAPPRVDHCKTINDVLEIILKVNKQL